MGGDLADLPAEVAYIEEVVLGVGAEDLGEHILAVTVSWIQIEVEGFFCKRDDGGTKKTSAL